MDFYLVKEKLRFENINEVSNFDPDILTKRDVLLGKRLTLGTVTNCVGELIEESDYGRTCFRTSLIKMLSGWDGDSVGRRWRSDSLSLTVDLTMNSTKTANVKVLTRNGHLGEVMGYQIFERLMNSNWLPTCFELNLNLKVFALDFEVDGKNLEIVKFEEENCYGLEITGIEIWKYMWSAWKGGPRYGFQGEISMTLRVDHSAVTKLYLETLGSTETLWPRNLIIEGVPSDLVILAGGEKVKEKGMKCHKRILSERSPVFKAMFQADMSESRDNCLEIVDMTEASVWAMLQFIYARDLEEASKKCEMAIELLEAGHKYGMADLEDAMMQLIWAKPVEWVSVDSALKMLLFSRNIGGKFEDVEKTSLLILKWYAQKSGSLGKSEEFQRLFLEYPRIAMELAESFLKI